MIPNLTVFIAIWSEWVLTTCSVSCGSGVRNRTRSKCDVPNVPSSCEYETETVSCNLGPCPSTIPPATTQPVKPTTSGKLD